MGVIVAIICSGAMTLIKHLLPDQGVAANRLLVGAIRDDADASHLWIVAILLSASLIVSLARARAMDIASLSDDEASSLGINLHRLRLTQFLIAGVLTGGSVVLAGPIGFVGLLCPHVIRAWIGPRHAPLLVGSALLGAATLVAADALIAAIRELEPGLGRLPLGALTALVGGPIFLFMLRKHPRA
jgi:iron complex transport system permease protein